MNNILVRHPVGVTLLGRGEVRAEDLAEALGHAPALVAVDGGARVAVELGHLPAAVIGDMDSLPPAQRLALPEGAFHRIKEQDSTDFDKALRSVAAPVILGVGFLGRRADHQLANFNVLIRRWDRRCILIGEHDVIFAAPAAITLDLSAGSRVSLFPLARVSGRSHGLHWPIDGIAMMPDGAIGTSNRVVADPAGPVRLEFSAPGMLIILPRVSLPSVLEGLAGAEPFAPAR